MIIITIIRTYFSLTVSDLLKIIFTFSSLPWMLSSTCLWWWLWWWSCWQWCWRWWWWSSFPCGCCQPDCLFDSWGALRTPDSTQIFLISPTSFFILKTSTPTDVAFKNCNYHFIDINPLVDDINWNQVVMTKINANLDNLTFCISTATPILFTSKKMMMRAARLNTKPLTKSWIVQHCSFNVRRLKIEHNLWKWIWPTLQTRPLLLGNHRFSTLVFSFINLL